MNRIVFKGRQMVKKLMGRVNRTATSRDKEYNVGTGSFSRYAYEFTTACGRFYVAEVRALTMLEAKHELDQYLRKQSQLLEEIVRKFDHGADRTWLQGTRNSWVKGTNTKASAAGVIEVRQYDRELYEQLRNAN